MTAATMHPNTQAILLLTAPLKLNGREPSAEQLTPGEYNRVARVLRERDREPADLLGPDTSEILQQCRDVVEPSRLERLLGRGFLLAQAIERWQARAIWIVSRADPEYPRRWKTRLRESAPPVVYGCGDATILETGGLAVVGSRDAETAVLAYAEEVGRLAASAKQTVISGGARGIDQAAIRGALNAGGRAVCVLADSLERVAVVRENRQALIERQLVLVSPYDPGAGFHVGQAMQRNKLIYGLADAGLVVSSDFETGGTWNGAVEQLEKLHLVPVYVRTRGDLGKGLEGLRARGALRWPEPASPEALVEALETPATRSELRQDELPFGAGSGASVVREPGPMARSSEPEATGNPAPGATPAEKLFDLVREILRRMDKTKTEAEVADLLQVSRAQVKVWLKRLVDEGAVTKLNRPARYRGTLLSARGQ